MKTILKVNFFLFNTFLFQIAFYEVLVAFIYQINFFSKYDGKDDNIYC